MTEQTLELFENKTENATYYCKEISSSTAKELVKKYHYSKQIVGFSFLHLGIFSKEDDSLQGVLSYGYTMFSHKVPQLYVKDSNKHEMLELNRMAMLDSAPKMSESQAIGLSIKWIRRFKPEIKWLLSFSDGKEGNIGIIYQATNWDYYGFKLSTNSFYELDGEIKHSVSVYMKYKNIKPENMTRTEYLCTIHDDVSMIHARQYIYIMPLTKNLPVILEKQSYPKKETEPKIVKRIVYKENGKILPKKKVISYI